MRSPMCAALLNRELANSDISRFTAASAGLNAIPGNPAHAWAIEAAKELDVSLQNHRAQLLTSQMVNEADMIFVMDYQNLVQILTRWPDAENKIFLLGAYAGTRYRVREIQDPYYLGPEGTHHCYATLAMCIHNLARLLSQQDQLGVRTDNQSRLSENTRQ